MLHIRTLGMAGLPSHSREPLGLLPCMSMYRLKVCQVFTDSPWLKGACVLIHCMLRAVNLQSLCQ